VIDSAHVKNTKPTISLAQCRCNTTYHLSTSINQTFKQISNNKHVRFTKHNEVHSFNNADTTIMVTYDSGADGNYISKKDFRRAGLPIL
jgi:hypothetical protein